MEITIFSKVQGHSEFSSESIGVTLKPADLGLEEPKNSKQAKKVFDQLADAGNFLVATVMYKYGLIGLKQAKSKRKRCKESGLLETENGKGGET